MPELSLAKLLRPEIGELAAYAPVAGDFAIRLDANEAPALLSESARARLGEVAASTAWERYPDARAVDLRRAIADRLGVNPDEILVGAGSDEVITMLLTALSLPRARGPGPTVLTTTPTFVMYRLSARVRGMNVVEVPLDAGWDLAADSMLRALEMAPPNLVFLASPNNPTGTCLSRERVERVIQAAEGALVVIDEAYVDYADGDLFDLYREHQNVAVLRTLSKIGFAALRVGWLVGRPDLVRELDKTRLPYNLPVVSQRLAALVLGELGHEVEVVTRAVIEERERLTAELGRLPGVVPTPSRANFVWFETARNAGEVFEALASRGILIRSFHARGGRLARQLRVTVGTREQNDAFLAALREVV